MHKVTQLTVLDNTRLLLSFDEGEQRIFDVMPYLERGAFKSLKDPARFRQAYVAFDTVCWPEGLDMSPDTLYQHALPANLVL